jgi:tRNA-uridine 2-sulfurtransferase
VLAQVRAHGAAVAASAEVVEGARGPEIDVRLHRPVRGVAPGQSVVLYDGSRVLGSALIASTGRPPTRESSVVRRPHQTGTA